MSGAAESHIKENIKTEKERATEREAGSSALWMAWFLKGSVSRGSTKLFNSDKCFVFLFFKLMQLWKRKKIERDHTQKVKGQFTFRDLVWYLIAFLVCSLAAVTWSTDWDTFCSMLFTISPWKKNNSGQKKSSRFKSAAQFALHIQQVVNETSTLKTNIHADRHPVFPRRDANNNTNSRTTPLPQTRLSLRKHGASSDKHVVRGQEGDQSSVHVCVGCDVKWALVFLVVSMPYSYSLLKRIQADSTHTK